MSRLRQGLGRRSAALMKHPRHFAQLLLPLVLALCGWLAIAVEWWRVGIILISAALLAFAALIWLRLRRMQMRSDRGVRTMVDRLDALALSVAASKSVTEAKDTRGAEDVKHEEEPPSSDEDKPSSSDVTLSVAAVMTGLPVALLRALDAAAPTSAHEAVLIVPNALASAVTNWMEATVPGCWTVLGEESDLLRPRAAGTRALVILDSEDRPTYEGVLDQSFFWWLPRSAHIHLVSHDVVAFASRLARQHRVGLALAHHGPGSAQASVTRKKDDRDA